MQALYKVSVDGGDLEQLPTTGLVDSFACSRTAQGRCVVRVVDNGEFVYYDLDPTSGQGKELARSEWMGGLMGDWSVSSDGKRVVTVSHDPSRPAIHFLRLDSTDGARPDVVVRAPGEPVAAEELVGGGEYYVQTKTGDERSLLLVDRFGAATTLLEEDHPVWGVPSRQGKVAFPSPTTNVNVWVGHLNSRHD